MACSSAKMPVFTLTNLGTRIVVPISPAATPIEFKKEFEKAHLNCFPEFGKIKVNAIMVKKKSCFYYLSKSMPLKHVFQGSKATWFLHVEASHWGIQDHPILSECVATQLAERVSEGDGGNYVTGAAQFKNFDRRTKKSKTKGKLKMRRTKGVLCLRTALLKVSEVVYISKRKKKTKKRKKRIKGQQTINCPKMGFERAELVANRRLDPLASKDGDNWRKELFPIPAVESPCETFLESVSVSGLIKKYFSYNDEVTSGCSRPAVQKHNGQSKARTDGEILNMHFATPSPSLAKLPQQKAQLALPDGPSSKSSRNKHKKPEVGKRLMLAAGNLGLSVHKPNSTLSVCKYRDKNKISMALKSTNLVQSLVYEISDEDD